MSFARPRIATSTICVFGVGSRLTSATKAPASLASEAKDAAGYRIHDVPMTSSTSAERTAGDVGFAAAVVPFPGQAGVPREGLRRCQVFGPVGPPEAVGSAKRRAPAVR